MALIPINDQHKLQIEAGTKGRNKGHWFEEYITTIINALPVTAYQQDDINTHQIIFNGDPAITLVQYVVSSMNLKFKNISKIEAFWLGGLATSGRGHVITDDNGKNIKASKSDILLKLYLKDGKEQIIGVSTKTCSTKTPTNDQLYFTTASGFCNLLRRNKIEVREAVEHCLKMFCGDKGFRPIDNGEINKGRKSDPDRWFWEELPKKSREDLEGMFTEKQDEITDALLRKAYENDPYQPDFLLHLTKKCEDIQKSEIAIFSMKNLIALSRKYCGFELRPYSIKKGRFKNDPHIHQAPRFGIVQMQRGGQKQHPTQLQFNLKAGYFYHLDELSK